MTRPHLAIKLLISATALSGCASWQLNYNTVDLATSSSSLVTDQILSNLAKFRASAYAIPSQVSIPSGSATTTNSVSPTIGGPIGAGVTTTLANAAATPLFLANTRTHVVPNGTFGASAADQWSQNWTLTPLEDPDQLRRLRALYRFGAGQITRAQFECEYPLVQKAPSSGGTGSQSVSVYVGAANSSIQTSENKAAPSVIYRKEQCGSTNVGTPDPAFMKPPGCIFCDYSSGDGLELSTRERKKLSGSLNQNSDLVTISPPISSSDVWRFIGQQISGLCIPASTVISSINTSSQIEISRRPNCDGKKDLSVAQAQGAPKTQTRSLKVNPALQNDWLWNPAITPIVPPDAIPLGSHAGQALYLYPDDVSQKGFSDFVLFVLEATLQSTSSSAGAGKGTSQKGGSTTPLQQPAAPQIQLLE
jgi:hypothetical protein